MFKQRGRACESTVALLSRTDERLLPSQLGTKNPIPEERNSCQASILLRSPDGFQANGTIWSWPPGERPVSETGFDTVPVETPVRRVGGNAAIDAARNQMPATLCTMALTNSCGAMPISSSGRLPFRPFIIGFALVQRATYGGEGLTRLAGNSRYRPRAEVSPSEKMEKDFFFLTIGEPCVQSSQPYSTSSFVGSWLVPLLPLVRENEDVHAPHRAVPP